MIDFKHRDPRSVGPRKARILDWIDRHIFGAPSTQARFIGQREPTIFIRPTANTWIYRDADMSDPELPATVRRQAE